MIQDIWILSLLLFAILAETFAHRFIILESFGVKERIYNRAWHIAFSVMWLMVWLVLISLGGFLTAILHATFRFTLFQWGLNYTLRQHSRSTERVTTAFKNRSIIHLSDSGMDRLFKSKLGEQKTFYLKLIALISITILYFIL